MPKWRVAMGFDWQDLAAGVIVLAAAVYLFRRFVGPGKNRRSLGCSSCAKCPASQPQQLVSLDSPARGDEK